MAEIAVRTEDGRADIDDASRWKLGDIVTVVEDGQNWTENDLRVHKIIKLPGVSVDRVMSSWGGPKEEPDRDEPDEMVVTQRSRCKYDDTQKCIEDKDDSNAIDFIEDIVADHGNFDELEAEYRVGRRDDSGRVINQGGGMNPRGR